MSAQSTPSPPARARRRSSSAAGGSVKSELKLRARDKQEGVVERYLRHELSRGVYNFKDVWRYFQRHGWTSRNGHELSYDHYYIKPGKDLATGEEDVDYFLGERALVAYAYELKIFGEVEDQPLAVASPSQLKETIKALSQQQPIASQPSRKRRRQQTPRGSAERSNSVSSSEESNGSGRSRRSVKSTGSKKSHRNNKGSRADNPILLSSDGSGSDGGHSSGKRPTESSSSDGEESSEWSGTEERGGFHEPDDEEEEDEDSASVEMSSEEAEEDEEEEEEEEDDDEVDSEEGDEHMASDAVADNSWNESESSRKAKLTHHKHKHKQNSSRPRLKTSTSKKQQQAQASPKPSSQGMHPSTTTSHKRKTSPLRESAAKTPLKHQKRNEVSQSHYDDENFTLGGDRYGASPPRRPPTSSRGSQDSRRRSAPSTPMSSFVGSDAGSCESEKEKAPRMQRKPAATSRAAHKSPSTSSQLSAPLSPPVDAWSEEHSFLSPAFGDTSFDVDVTESADISDTQDTIAGLAADNVHRRSSSPSRSTPSPSTSIEVEVPVRSTSIPSRFSSETFGPSELRKTLLEMKDVQFPRDALKDKFHVLVATRLDGATCIRIKHEHSHIERQCVFRDVKDIRENKGNNPYEVPSNAVIEALLRCLRALPGKIINTGRLTESKEGPGKIELLRVEPQNISESDSGETPPLRCMTLRFAFPCFEFWQCHHNFPMTLVPATESRVAELISELKVSATRIHNIEEELESVMRECEGFKKRVDELERERECLQQQLAAAKRDAGEINHTSSPEAKLAAKYKAKLAQSRAEIAKLKTELSELKNARPPNVVAIKPEPSRSARDHHKSPRQNEKQPEAPPSVVLESPWLEALKPQLVEAVAGSVAGVPLEWSTVVTIKGDHYQTHLNSSEGHVGPVVVLKTGTYQVNAHVTHEKDMRIVLRIVSPQLEEGSSTFVDATLIQMYDNKRRTSRIDRVVTLHANDRVTIVLQRSGNEEADSSVPKTWPAIFKPRHNQFVLTLLDPHIVYESAARNTN